MAEIGLIASIVGIVGAGVKLSIATFDFAASIGSAGKELQHVATEVSDLCAVLKHLQALLEHAHFRPSHTAIADIQKIIKHCEEVFSEIEEAISKLKTSKSNDLFPAATPDFISKVKWTFQKPKIQMQRSTLDACKSTLSLMLNTMILADALNHLDSQASNLVEEEQNRAMTQSLVIAQQCAVEQLEFYEDEVERQDEVARALPGISSQNQAAITSRRRKSKTRLVGMFSGLSVITDLPSSETKLKEAPNPRARASIWLDGIVTSADEPLDPHPGERRRKRMSSAGTAKAPAQLLRKWTSHVDKLDLTSRIRPREGGGTEGNMDEIWSNSEFTFSMSTIPEQNQHIDPSVGISRASSGMISPKTSRARSVSLNNASRVKGALASTLAPDEKAESYESVTKAVLDGYGAPYKPSEVSLYIHFAGKTKWLSPSDQPLQLLFHYEELDLEPRLFVQRKIT